MSRKTIKYKKYWILTSRIRNKASFLKVYKKSELSFKIINHFLESQ